MKKKIFAAIGLLEIIMMLKVDCMQDPTKYRNSTTHSAPTALGNPKFDVKNGITGMGRDVVLRILKIIRSNVHAVRAITAMTEDHYKWRHHKYFLINRYIDPVVAMRTYTDHYIIRQSTRMMTDRSMKAARITLEAGPGNSKEIKRDNIPATMERIGKTSEDDKCGISHFLSPGFADSTPKLETMILFKLALPDMSPANARSLLRHLVIFVSFKNPLRNAAIKRIIKEKRVSYYGIVSGPLLFKYNNMAENGQSRMFGFLGLIFSSKGENAEQNKADYLVAMDEQINKQKKGKSPSDLIAAEKYIEEQMKKNKESGTRIEARNNLDEALEIKLLTDGMIKSPPKI